MERREPESSANRLRSIPRGASKRDRALVEWVAQASVGDAFPEPWSYARSPLESIILTLAQLGVMARPAPGSEWSAIVQDATAGARRWLVEHPPDAPGPASTA